MASYEIREIEIDQLLLDLQNPRQDLQEHQRDAIASMVNTQGSKLANLAKDIVDFGMNPSELLIVAPDPNNREYFVVLEGNRRLAALKLLREPAFVTSLAIQQRYKNRLLELSKIYQNSPIDKLFCAIFPERDSANKWIELKHTGENKGVGVVSWDASAVARFKMRMGKPDKHNVAIQAVDFVMENGSLDEETQNNLGSIAITNLSRLLADPKVRDFLGVEVDNNYLMTRFDSVTLFL